MIRNVLRAVLARAQAALGDASPPAPPSTEPDTTAPDSVPPTAEPLNDPIRLTTIEHERISLARREEAATFDTAKSRRTLLTTVLWIFVGGNVAMWITVGLLAWADHTNLRDNTIASENLPVARVIDGDVVLALIAGTVTQVGAILFGASRNLFRSAAD